MAGSFPFGKFYFAGLQSPKARGDPNLPKNKKEKKREVNLEPESRYCARNPEKVGLSKTSVFWSLRVAGYSGILEGGAT